MDIRTIGERLCSLCREGKNIQAINELYADDIVSIEATELGERNSPPRTIRGKDQVLGKIHWWFEHYKINSVVMEGPFLHGTDAFATYALYSVTPKSDSKTTMQMREVSVYTTRNGKISEERFFYTL